MDHPLADGPPDEPAPLPLAEVAAEAERVRMILDNDPPNDLSDMLYAAYNALLFVLGYGVAPPTELWGPLAVERHKKLDERARAAGQTEG